MVYKVFVWSKISRRKCSPPPRGKAALVLGFGVFLVFLVFVFASSPVYSAFKCTLCPENYYCKSAEKFLCPGTTPVSIAGAKSESECTTCFGKTQNNSQVVWLGGECVSCAEGDLSLATPVWGGTSCTTCFALNGESAPAWNDNLTTPGCSTCYEANGTTAPYWDGDSCEACPSGTSWSGSECVSAVPTGAVFIPTNDGGYYLSSDMIFPANTSIITTSCSVTDPTDCEEGEDYWAGATKTCSDQGKRLPTPEELTALAEALFDDGFSTITNKELAEVIVNSNADPHGLYYFWSSEVIWEGTWSTHRYIDVSYYAFVSKEDPIYGETREHEEGHHWDKHYVAFCLP